MALIVGTAIHDTFELYDTADVLVTGKVNADFTKKLYRNGALDGSVTGTVTEVAGSAGTYDAAFTPNAAGIWRHAVSVTHNSHLYTFTSDAFDVVTAAEADPFAALVTNYATGTVGALLSNLGFIGGQSFLVESGRLFTVRGTVLLVPTVDGVIELM